MPSVRTSLLLGVSRYPVFRHGAHALGTYIIVTGVHHIAKSVFRLPIEFIGPLENLVPDLCHARINLKLAVSAFGEQRMLRTYLLFTACREIEYSESHATAKPWYRFHCTVSRCWDYCATRNVIPSAFDPVDESSLDCQQSQLLLELGSRLPRRT